MLVEKTSQVINGVKEIKEWMFHEFGSEMLNDMDEQQFMLMRKLFMITDLSLELVEEQAVVMDEMNKKLDRLLLQSDGINYKD